MFATDANITSFVSVLFTRNYFPNHSAVYGTSVMICVESRDSLPSAVCYQKVVMKSILRNFLVERTPASSVFRVHDTDSLAVIERSPLKKKYCVLTVGRFIGFSTRLNSKVGTLSRVLLNMLQIDFALLTTILSVSYVKEVSRVSCW